MKKCLVCFYMLFCIGFIFTIKTVADTPQIEMKSIPSEVVIDKIRGGLLGQILGDLNGMRHEGRYRLTSGNVMNYVPSLPDGAWTDDDTDFEWFYIFEIQKNRNAFIPPYKISSLWKERVNRGVYCSNRFARYLMDLGFKPPYTGYTIFNPWAEFNISGQFLAETYGLLAPAMPQTAAKIGLNYTTVAINNEPAQTTQLFTTMVAMAFVENDINKILDAGIATLDPNSIIVDVINDIKKWHTQYPENWKETRRLMNEKYILEGGRGTRDFNGHELNTGSIIAALLYGKGNFEESVKHAFNFGWDADCNAATVGTIIGVTYGYRKMLHHNDENMPEWLIVDRYRNTTRDNMPMNETITSYADRLIEIFEMINENNGGKKAIENNQVVYQIPAENPAMITKLVSMEDQKSHVKEEFENQIRQGILSTDREARARAAYMAVCLDMAPELAKINPKQWKVACRDLSGYWKIMNNIFFGDFKSLQAFAAKFKEAGLKSLPRQFTDNEIYNDKAFWKNPEELYTVKKIDE